MQPTAEQIEQDLLRPLFHSSGKYWIAVAIATSLLLAGVAAELGLGGLPPIGTAIFVRRNRTG